MICLLSSELHSDPLCYRKPPKALFKKKASQTASSTTKVSTHKSEILLESQPHPQPSNDLTDEKEFGRGVEYIHTSSCLYPRPTNFIACTLNLVLPFSFDSLLQ